MPGSGWAILDAMATARSASNVWSRDRIEVLAGGDRAHVWHPYDAMPARVRPYPVVAAEGVRLHLADGRQVIDGMSSWWAAIHGYNHPRLNQALRDQLDNMAHVMLGGLTHPPAVELAERLVALAPNGLEHVFFSDSGSVAVEVAIKMALQYWVGRGRPAKRRLLTVRGGYHGDTFAAMTVCDPVTGMHHLFEHILSAQLFAPMPEPAYGQPLRPDHTTEIEALIAGHHHELAAVIIEPVVQGAGGMRFYTPDYLCRLRQLCDTHQLLLIADEIATGFGRTGEMFAVDHAHIAPDIICVGKALTGGYLPMAATISTAEVSSGVCAAEPGALMHGPTFMANPLAAAVSTANLELLTGRDWRSDIARIQYQLTRGLRPAQNINGVAEVRVLGAIGVIETDQPVSIEAAQTALIEHGVWLRPFGKLLYTMPSYTTTNQEIDQITQAMLTALHAHESTSPPGRPAWHSSHGTTGTEPSPAVGSVGELPPLAAEDHICDVCGVVYADVTVDGALQIIATLPGRIQAAVEALPEASLRQRPQEQMWSPLEYLCHLRDLLVTATIRLHRTRTEDSPAIEPMFNDLRAARFHYNRRQLGAIVDEIADNVAGFLAEAIQVPDKDWDRTLRRLPGEIRTARWLLRQTMHEGEHHLRDILAADSRHLPNS
ncbi:MAG: adenosylmethionine--8-amino-7-oxononanoate transaminase [Acidimicrobiales bacterium]|nr:adenosylmethionine--8-amino-7-oxononanoate transaminase [Acidimicrobiales bacterium]